MDISNITPNWNISEFYNLDYKLDKHKDQNLIDQYLNIGYAESSLTLYNYFEPNKMPECVYSYIKPKFSFLDKISMAINLFKPGQFIPHHCDFYQRYKTSNNINSSKNIVRCILMLEDGMPGQILEVKGLTYTMWEAGRCFFWQNNEPHAFYNFSLKNRYAIQITGVKNA